MSRSARPLTSARVLHKIKELTTPQASTEYVINRNPRNLERLRIAYKPGGYHLEKPGRSYWHTLEINASGRYVSADVKHFENGTILSASTSEWAIKQHLYKTNDTSAFVNLGRVLAHRCLQSGITEMTCNVEAVPGSKLQKLLKTIQDNGVSFTEPSRLPNEQPWDEKRHEKPWEVSEEALEVLEAPKSK
ncbi:39S ribosomal protein L18, mitochondrial [Drosophila sechellia]|uniref:Large ribosomal subunit protein uL18m n=1 Tax=Drosophila sechellia TaxID=7238 RepID=B4HPP0_DROSE|nr:39S ribosomal protein L18, mitochondrial [Drosophila sechellia]EDW47624.1 GM21422 [Drosophila sechellia]